MQAEDDLAHPRVAWCAHLGDETGGRL